MFTKLKTILADLRDRIASLGDSAQTWIFFAHAATGALIVSLFHGTALLIAVPVAVLVVTYKELIFDYKYELPKNSWVSKTTLSDYLEWLLGIAVGAMIAYFRL